MNSTMQRSNQYLSASRRRLRQRLRQVILTNGLKMRLLTTMASVSGKANGVLKKEAKRLSKKIVS